MENVYMIGIVGIVVVILGVVWFLRNRITGGTVDVSTKDTNIKGQFTAASPAGRSIQDGSAPSKRQSMVDISGNWMIGANILRVSRERVRIAFNRLLGRHRIEVQEDSSDLALRRRKRRSK